MSTTVLVVHLFICLKITVVSNQDCRSVRSVADFALFRHTYRQKSGTRLESCAATCDADPLCYSFNYFVPTMTCELNNSSRSADSGNFQRKSGSVYLDKLKEPADYCVSFPCRNNGTCKPVRRHPGFECFCHDEFTGVKCEICSSSPLGLGSRQLPDENFNASSSVDPYKPSDARLHTNTSWVSVGDYDQFLQISFQPNPKLVTGVATQGNPEIREEIKSMYVCMYVCILTIIGLSFFTNFCIAQMVSRGYTTSIKADLELERSCKRPIGFPLRQCKNCNHEQTGEVFAANQDNNTTITNQLQPPIRAMYLRIAPLHWQEKIALRVEIYGCNDHS